MYLKISRWELNNFRPPKKNKTLNFPPNSPFFMFSQPKFCMHFVFPLMCLCLSGSCCENKQPAYYGLWTFSTFHKSAPSVRIVNHINLVCTILLISERFILILASQPRGDFFWHTFFPAIPGFICSRLTKLRKPAISLVISIHLSVCPSVRPSVCPSVRPSAWNNSALTERIFMKFDFWVFFEKYVEKMKFWLKSEKTEELCKFMTVSRRNLLRTINFFRPKLKHAYWVQ